MSQPRYIPHAEVVMATVIWYGALMGGAMLVLMGIGATIRRVLK